MNEIVNLINNNCIITENIQKKSNNEANFYKNKDSKIIENDEYDDREYENKLNKRNNKRECSVANFHYNEYITSRPNYCKVFENINIFNSILIMMNNIDCINNYLSNNITKKYIYSCERNKQYCLSSILYYINKYIWNFKEKSEISEINLVVYLIKILM